MKALTKQQGGNRYLQRSSKVMVRKATKYFTAAAAEILLEKFKWSQERTIDFLERFYAQYISMDGGYVRVQEFADMLRDDYGYEVRLRHKCEKTDATPIVLLEQRMTDLCLLWIAQIMALTLMDKFGWGGTTVTRFVRHLDQYVRRFADGGGDHESRLQHLRDAHGLDIRAHIKMGGEAL